jgi:L-ribulose-5-phosphate 3-epimerase UlaE
VLAKKIATSLKEAGYDVWFDEEKRKTGSSYIDEIQEGLSQSRFVAAMFSKESLKSGWFKAEWQAKMAEGEDKKKITVLAIKVDECELPIFFKHRNHADFRTDYESGLRNLLEAIKEHK